MKKIENSYKKSGVNIPLANKLVIVHIKFIKKNDKKRNLNKHSETIGGFASLFDMSEIKILKIQF